MYKFHWMWAKIKKISELNYFVGRVVMMSNTPPPPYAPIYPTQNNRTHLLDGVAKFATGKLVPETLNGSKVGGWDVLDLGPVNEVTSLLLGTGKNDQGIASELYKRNME